MKEAITKGDGEERTVEAIGDAGESGGEEGFVEGESYPEPPEDA